jgi:hypothetical protein
MGDLILKISLFFWKNGFSGMKNAIFWLSKQGETDSLHFFDLILNT